MRETTRFIAIKVSYFRVIIFSLLFNKPVSIRGYARHLQVVAPSVKELNRVIRFNQRQGSYGDHSTGIFWARIWSSIDRLTRMVLGNRFGICEEILLFQWRNALFGLPGPRPRALGCVSTSKDEIYEI